MSNLIGVIANGNAEQLADNFNEQAYCCSGNKCSADFSVVRSVNNRFLVIGAEGNEERIQNILQTEAENLGGVKFKTVPIETGWSDLESLNYDDI